MADLKAAIARYQEDDRYGLHGVRVLGYNLSVEGNGEDLTVAHGRWKSTAHTRYQRFTMSSVLTIPSAMVNEESPYTREVAREGGAGVRQVVRDPDALQRGSSAVVLATPARIEGNRPGVYDEDGPWSGSDEEAVARARPVVQAVVVAERVSPALTRARAGRGGRGGRGMSSA